MKDEVHWINNLEKPSFGGTIRDLETTDLESLRPILETWLKDRNTGELLPKEVEETLKIMQESISGSNDRTYIVAENEGEVVGVIGFKNPDKRMISFTQTPRPAELINAYVKADARKGNGVGRALVAELEIRASERGFTEIVLNSGPRYKETGWGFYDRLVDYSRVGVAKEYYGEGGDAPVWRKQF